MRRSTRRRDAAAHSLLELLIAMALGLLASAAVLSLYLGQHALVERSDEADRIAHAGMATLGLLAQQTRMAGFAPLAAHAEAEIRLPVFGCSGGKPSGGSAGAARCTPGEAASDGIVFRYVADTISTWASNTGRPTDCLGQQVLPPSGAPAIVENRFYTKVGVSGVPELYCGGNGGNGTSSPQPIVAGVERLQMGYWLPGAVTSVSAAALTEGLWPYVRAVDFCVIVQGAISVLPPAYRDCAGRLVEPADRRVRRAFFTHVALRNASG